MKTVDILIKAKNIIETFGFTKHTFGSEESGFCAIGALNHLSVPSKRYWTAMRYLSHAVQNRTGNGSIALFNDSPVTSKEDVLDLFAAAIKNAKRRHSNGK